MRRSTHILTAVVLVVLSVPIFGAAPARGPVVPVPSLKESAARDLADFMDRASKLREDDIEGRLTLARWSYSRQMYSQAVEMANQALYRDPGNRAAYTILQQVDDARPLPEKPDVELALKEEMQRRFKHDFRTRNSKHFVLVYDTTDAFAAQRATSMEKVYDAFRFYFNMNTLRPDFLEERLVVVLFKDREDYLAYIKQTENADFSWSAGFYSQRSNRSAFYDEASGSTAASVSKQADELKARIDEFNRQIATARGQNQTGMVNNLTVQRNRVSEALAQFNNRLGNQVLLQNNSKTMHEAAHQVAFNMGIQTRTVDYPMWLSEGMACSFEFEDSAGHRGPALLNTGRISIIKGAIRDNKLPTIEKVISEDPEDTPDEATLSIAYAEAWALFHYLYKYHRQGMEDYLLAYKNHRILRRIGPEERRTMFTKAFGADLDALNRKFVDYLKSLPGKAP